MSWFVEECSQYEELDRYRTPPEELFTQVKSRNKLNPRGLAILRELARIVELNTIIQSNTAMLRAVT